MDQDREFHALHLPNLINYVVPIFRFEHGGVKLGSGVLVKAGRRHLVATAKHCIDSKIRVVRSCEPLHAHQSVTGTRELRVLQKGWHDTLDLGYLEIQNPQCGLLGWHQLCTDKIVEGLVQFVGHPVQMVDKTLSSKGVLTDVSLVAGTFATTLIEETDDRMVFGYPKIGAKYEETTGQWHESAFPETPEGFSGGACFGVVMPEGKIARADYKLLAIDYAWRKDERVVYATPIKRWKELMVQRGLYQ